MTIWHNLPEYTVSEIGQAVKRMVEDQFGLVRVRGEMSGTKQAGSGHWYFTLKDAQAVLDAVCWKVTAQKMVQTPEDGLEVICTGRMTTDPGRSKYQLVVEDMQPAGEGALMALLERRKQALAAEGLFAEERKKPLPFLPARIGVVTSPSGAVLRDILHRVQDRFPVTVTLWPVLVQGEGAAEQVAKAVAGFNSMPERWRPDVLIVARGGGSLEDLWAFNEEIAVRAVAASRIPVISAVGHETDITLMDLVADKRAPTPTGAAEMAVPVLTELRLSVRALQLRLGQAMQQQVKSAAQALAASGRGLPRAEHVLWPHQQRLDMATMALRQEQEGWLLRQQRRLEVVAQRLQRPEAVVLKANQRVQQQAGRLQQAMQQQMRQRHWLLVQQQARLLPEPLLRHISAQQREVERLQQRLQQATKNLQQRGEQRLHYASGLLNSYDYRQVLKRGYALVRDAEGQLVAQAADARPGQPLQVEWADGALPVTVGVATPDGAVSAAPARSAPKKKASAVVPQDQGSLW